MACATEFTANFCCYLPDLHDAFNALPPIGSVMSTYPEYRITRKRIARDELRDRWIITIWFSPIVREADFGDPLDYQLPHYMELSEPFWHPIFNPR